MTGNSKSSSASKSTNDHDSETLVDKVRKANVGPVACRLASRRKGKRARQLSRLGVLAIIAGIFSCGFIIYGTIHGVELGKLWQETLPVLLRSTSQSSANSTDQDGQLLADGSQPSVVKASPLASIVELEEAFDSLDSQEARDAQLVEPAPLTNEPEIAPIAVYEVDVVDQSDTAHFMAQLGFETEQNLGATPIGHQLAEELAHDMSANENVYDPRDIDHQQVASQHFESDREPQGDAVALGSARTQDAAKTTIQGETADVVATSVKTMDVPPAHTAQILAVAVEPLDSMEPTGAVEEIVSPKITAAAQDIARSETSPEYLASHQVAPPSLEPPQLDFNPIERVRDQHQPIGIAPTSLASKELVAFKSISHSAVPSTDYEALTVRVPPSVPNAKVVDAFQSQMKSALANYRSKLDGLNANAGKKRLLQRDYYAATARLCDLANQADFVPEEIAELIAEVESTPKLFSLVSAASTSWIRWPKRTSAGVLIAGTLAQADSIDGDLVLRIKTNDKKSSIIDVRINPLEQQPALGEPVVVMARVVQSNAEIRGILMTERLSK